MGVNMRSTLPFLLLASTLLSNSLLGCSGVNGGAGANSFGNSSKLPVRSRVFSNPSLSPNKVCVNGVVFIRANAATNSGVVMSINRIKSNGFEPPRYEFVATRDIAISNGEISTTYLPTAIGTYSVALSTDGEAIEMGFIAYACP